MAAECFCERDDDGRCPKCSRAFMEKGKKVVEVIRENAERMMVAFSSEPGCDKCERENIDRIYAEMLKEMVNHTTPEFFGVTAHYMRSEARKLGPTPLMDRAMRELGVDAVAARPFLLHRQLVPQGQGLAIGGTVETPRELSRDEILAAAKRDWEAVKAAIPDAPEAIQVEIMRGVAWASLREARQK